MDQCVVCEKPLFVDWTDTHGIAACCSCNTPYRIFHYEGKRRVDKPPTCLVSEPWLSIVREYWEENHLMTPNGCNFPGSSYEHCSDHDFTEWNEWCEKNSERLPVDASAGD